MRLLIVLIWKFIHFCGVLKQVCIWVWLIGGDCDFYELCVCVCIIAGENVKPREMTIEKKIDLLESLTGNVIYPTLDFIFALTYGCIYRSNLYICVFVGFCNMIDFLLVLSERRERCSWSLVLCFRYWF